MQKLLNTLYVTSEDCYLALEGETVIVLQESDKLAQIPLHTLEGIMSFSYKGASPALMGACARKGINLSFFNPRGRFLARVCGENHGNVLLRKQQYRISDDEAASCLYARNMITGKIFNSKWSIERSKRDYPMRIDVEKMESASNFLSEYAKDARKSKDLDVLRGIEGEAAQKYFSVINELILNQKEEFEFTGRNRRPPLDMINALLSFVYTLLSGNCASALEGAGLDSYIGFLHRDRPGRPSMALDLMEELRPILADRFVITLINKRFIKPEHFEEQENGAVLLNKDGREIVLTNWQNKKKEELTHPYLEQKMVWGLIPHIQALLLARTIRGDLSEYPVFMWK